MLRYKTLAAAALVAMIAAGVARAEGTDPVIAKVGDQEIRQSELDLAVTSLDPQLQRMPDEQKRAAALSAVIDVKLLLKDAEKEGLQNDETFKQRIAFLTERELHNAYFKKHVIDAVTPEEVKARYDKEIAAIPPQEEVKARHILVKTEDEAKAVIKELDAGKNFAELAKAKSTDPNKDEGGDLGYFTKGRMVPEFRNGRFRSGKGRLHEDTGQDAVRLPRHPRRGQASPGAADAGAGRAPGSPARHARQVSRASEFSEGEHCSRNLRPGSQEGL